MFDFFKKKNNLLKQKECIEALQYLLQENNIQIYYTVQNLIKYHEDFFNNNELNQNTLNNPLNHIKRIYTKDLESRYQELKTASPNQKQQILDIIEADKMLLNELNEEYIKTYDNIEQKIYTVNYLKNTLNEEQQELLNHFEEIYNKKANIKSK